MTLYHDLADPTARLIAEGVLRPGDRLPSIRQTCRAHGISPVTVTQAYYPLESRGLVDARPKSGYFVRARLGQCLPEPEMTHPVGHSTVLEVSDFIFQILESVKDPSVVPLGSSFPSPYLFPFDKLGRCLATAARRLDPLATGWPGPAAVISCGWTCRNEWRRWCCTSGPWSRGSASRPDRSSRPSGNSGDASGSISGIRIRHGRRRRSPPWCASWNCSYSVVHRARCWPNQVVMIRADGTQTINTRSTQAMKGWARWDSMKCRATIHPFSQTMAATASCSQGAPADHRPRPRPRAVRLTRPSQARTSGDIAELAAGGVFMIQASR